MTAERDLLQQLQRALQDTQVDIEAMVAAARDEAHREVAETLRRLIVHDLLQRAIAALGGTSSEAPVAPTAAPSAVPRQAPEVLEGDVASTYLYGIARAGTGLPADLPQLPGGSRVRTVERDGLCAIVCDLDQQVLDVLGAPGPDGLDVLVVAAQAHDSTLATIAGKTTVLPLRLGTVVPDDTTVHDLLDRHAETLLAELERVEGCAEWAVTVHLMEPPPATEADDASASGREYLAQRQAALQARQRRRGARTELADAIHARLTDAARDADVVLSKPLEDIAPPLLHGVYLVQGEDGDAFAGAVEAVRAAHPEARIDVTGPWPPYHFTAVQLGEAAT
jgi:hypothetical protein